jgi:hypothetical protein
MLQKQFLGFLALGLSAVTSRREEEGNGDGMKS